MHSAWIRLLAAALVAIAAIQSSAVQAQAEYDTSGQTMYQGDILLTEEQQATLEATSNPNDPFSPQQAVVRNPRSLWPNAVVPYIIDVSLGEFAV